MNGLAEAHKQDGSNWKHIMRANVNQYGITMPMSFKDKRSYIAMIASRLFAEKGYHQTSARDISDAAGMTVGNMYSYISRKENLLYLVLIRYHQRLKKILFDRKQFVYEDPIQSLKQFVSNFINNKKEFKDEMMMINCECRFLSKENLAVARVKEIEGIHKLENIIRDGVNQGIFRVKDSYFAAAMIIYQLSILAMKGWIFEEKYQTEEIDVLLEDHILNAILY